MKVFILANCARMQCHFLFSPKGQSSFKKMKQYFLFQCGTSRLKPKFLGILIKIETPSPKRDKPFAKLHIEPTHSCLLNIQGMLLLFSCSVMPNSLQPHGWQHSRLSCPSLSPRVCSNSCPLSQRCHPIISSSFTCFSSCLQSLLATGSLLVSRLFASGGQSIGASVSASVLPMNIQG